VVLGMTRIRLRNDGAGVVSEEKRRTSASGAP